MSISRKVFEVFFIVCVFVGNAKISSAQNSIQYLENATGKRSGYTEADIAKKIDGIKTLDKSKAASLKRSLNEQMKIFYSHPLFNPPVGFSPGTSFGISVDPFLKKISILPCALTFHLRYLIKDKKTGEMKQMIGGATIGVETNAENHFFRQVGNFWEHCSKLGLPLFFEEPPIVKTTADYMELDFKKYGYAAIAPTEPFRIVTRKDKALFIPLTRREFMQFVIAEKKFQAKDLEKSITDTEKNIRGNEATIKDPGPYMTAEVLKVMKEGIVNSKKHIEDTKLKLVSYQNKIKEYESLMQNMTPEEASSPARIDYEIIVRDFDRMKRLVPVGIRKGIGLFKINPDYYDRNPGAPGAQSIFVYTKWSNLTSRDNYLIKKVIKIYNELDYAALKATLN